MRELDIKDKLASWGAWSRADGHGLGYISPSWLIMRGHVEQNKPPPKTYYISDDDAIMVDAAIKVLRGESEVLFEIIRLKYYELWSAKQIARYYLTDKEYPNLVGLDWEPKDKKKSDYRHVGLMLKEAERLIEQYLQ